MILILNILLGGVLLLIRKETINLNFIILLIYRIALLKTLFLSNQLLSLLLILEFLMLTNLLTLTLNLPAVSPNSVAFLMVLTLAVCEARLGLGLLLANKRLYLPSGIPTSNVKLSKLTTFKVVNGPHSNLV